MTTVKPRKSGLLWLWVTLAFIGLIAAWVTLIMISVNNRPDTVPLEGVEENADG